MVQGQMRMGHGHASDVRASNSSTKRASRNTRMSVKPNSARTPTSHIPQSRASIRPNAGRNTGQSAPNEHAFVKREGEMVIREAETGEEGEIQAEVNRRIREGRAIREQEMIEGRRGWDEAIRNAHDTGRTGQADTDRQQAGTGGQGTGKATRNRTQTDRREARTE